MCGRRRRVDESAADPHEGKTQLHRHREFRKSASYDRIERLSERSAAKILSSAMLDNCRESEFLARSTHEANTTRLGVDQGHPTPQATENQTWESGSGAYVQHLAGWGEMRHQAGRLDHMAAQDPGAFIRSDQTLLDRIRLEERGETKQPRHGRIVGLEEQLLKRQPDRCFTCYHTV